MQPQAEQARERACIGSLFDQSPSVNIITLFNDDVDATEKLFA